MIPIVILNESTVLAGQDLAAVVAALPALLPGGDRGELAVGVPASGGTQISDMRRLSARHAVRAGSRRHRRTLPRTLWRRSDLRKAAN